jgi:predicted flavoprotein YhiN
LRIDLAPDEPLAKSLRHAKDHSRQELGNVLAQWLPRRLVAGWVGSQMSAGGELLGRKIAELSNKTVDQIAISLKRWEIVPNGTEGFRKAEVTVGGVDTRALSPRSMEALEQRGLYFIGEVVDVTGWLGGYNFQWAWSSAAAAARAL